MPDPIDLNAAAAPGSALAGGSHLVFAGQPLLRDRSSGRRGLAAVRHTPPGWPRVQAICDFVHNHITFGYEHSRATRTAYEAYGERNGVCRDYAHLAITFCRCLNIPARYCTGYLTDVGLPPPYPPNDFAAWIEVYLGGRWHTFDPRNNAPGSGGSSSHRAAMPRMCR